MSDDAVARAHKAPARTPSEAVCHGSRIPQGAAACDFELIADCNVQMWITAERNELLRRTAELDNQLERERRASFERLAEISIKVTDRARAKAEVTVALLRERFVEHGRADPLVAELVAFVLGRSGRPEAT